MQCVVCNVQDAGCQEGLGEVPCQQEDQECEGGQRDYHLAVGEEVKRLQTAQDSRPVLIHHTLPVSCLSVCAEVGPQSFLV